MKEVGQLTCGAPSRSGKLYDYGSISTALSRDASEHLTECKAEKDTQETEKGRKGNIVAICKAMLYLGALK